MRRASTASKSAETGSPCGEDRPRPWATVPDRSLMGVPIPVIGGCGDTSVFSADASSSVHPRDWTSVLRLVHSGCVELNQQAPMIPNASLGKNG